MVSTHRHIYAALLGGIPDGLHICHHCDNPPCVRPGHLFAGTNADNSADRDQKGRHNTARGERHWSARLTEAKVLEIRRLASEGVSLRALARQFGVSHINIGQIIRRELWAHV
jgi:hypothetical protein